MKKLTGLFLILTLVACGPTGVVTQTVTSSPSSTLVPPTVNNTATPMPTNTPVAVTERCVEILPAFPGGSVPPGTLVMDSSGKLLSLLNFRQNTQRTISVYHYAVSTSPNGKWLSYVTDVTDSSSDEQYKLIVESADGQKKAQVILDSNLIFWDLLPWLDNERMWFPVDTVDANPPTLLLNPFTGEQQLLTADYPNIHSYYYGPGSGPPLNFGYSNVSYDPSLRYVVYPLDVDDGMYIALWDRETRQIVAKVLGVGKNGPLPLWLPNGSGVVVAAQPAGYEPYEWFLMGKNGEIRRLTHFGDIYSKYGFSQTASLSPDGRYLAFGVKGLTILDLQTLEVVNTCLKKTFYLPIWSPDSRYLAIHWDDNNKKQDSVLVLDFESGWAVTVFTEEEGALYTVAPRGWLDFGE